MEMDYSFMYVGGLQQDSVEIMRELCRRFGADKAENVYLSMIDSMRRDDPMAALIQELKEECGISPSPDDLAFLREVGLAVNAIQTARSFLKAALKK